MNTIKLNTIGERPIKKGGASGGGGGGNYVYYSVDSSLGEGFIEVLVVANIIKVMKDGVLSFDLPASFVVRDISIDTILAVGFDKSLKLTNYQTGELVTIEEFVIPFMDQQFTRLTEEEFYMINHFMIANGMLNASDDPFPITFKYDEGMTWEQWINSSYNAYGYFIEGQEVKGVFARKTRDGYPSSGNISIYSESDGYIAVKPDDIIKSCIYEIFA